MLQVRPDTEFADHTYERSTDMLFNSGDQIEITYLEGGLQDQLCCMVIEEEQGMLKVAWGPDVIVFNTHADSFVRARVLQHAPADMTVEQALAWHTERLEAVHEAFVALDQPSDAPPRPSGGG
jgi:hypothetical protein